MYNFPLLGKIIFLQCLCHILPTPSSVNRHFGCFYFLTIENDAVMNVGKQMSVLQGGFLEAGMFHHMVSFLGVLKLLPIVVGSFYILPAMQQESRVSI